MSSDQLTLAGVDILDAARAAVEGLPSGMAWTVAAADPAVDALVPGSGAAAAMVSLGAYGRLVLATSKPLSRQVQVGPPPAEDLLEGITRLLGMVLQTLSAEVGSVIEPGAYEEIDPATALTAGPGQVMLLAHILEGETHAATLAVVTPEFRVVAPPSDLPEAYDFGPLPESGGGRLNTGLEILHEVEMGVTAELGRARMQVREILDLCPGSVIELDRAAGSPVDILVNGTLIARGEVVVIDEEFGVRITEVVGYEESTGKRTA
jgi:flagellar motor switch protein FliN/FliY